MNVLKQWSNKNTFNVIFDSKVDGDGCSNVLHDKVFNKSNLYFIHFDGNNNVFGGYINSKINKSGISFDSVVYDKNAFVFSLMKNGKVNNKRYFKKQDDDGAILLINIPVGLLYSIGNDICAGQIGLEVSFVIIKTVIVMIMEMILNLLLISIFHKVYITTTCCNSNELIKFPVDVILE